MSRVEIVAFDTNLIIYWLEKNPAYIEDAFAILAPVIEQKQRAVVSVLLCTEILSGASNPRALEPLFMLPSLKLVPLSLEIALLAGELCSTYGLRSIDATHLATALTEQAKSFVTNDKQLLKLGRIKTLRIVPIA